MMENIWKTVQGYFDKQVAGSLSVDWQTGVGLVNWVLIPEVFQLVFFLITVSINIIFHHIFITFYYCVTVITLFHHYFPGLK